MPNTKPVVGAALRVEDIEYEEWLSISDATFYIQLELQLALGRDSILRIGKKFECIKGKGEGIRVQRGPLIEVCRKLYFPDIPKGWKSFTALATKYKMTAEGIGMWAEKGMIKYQILDIGMTEVPFVEEKEFRQCFNRQRSRKHSKGRIPSRKAVGSKRKRRNLDPNRSNPS